jgi:two-component system, NtrC family, response regulator AtoC
MAYLAGSMRSISNPTAVSKVDRDSASGSLVVMCGTEPRRVEVPARGTWVVGRSRHAQLELRDPSLSRRHALLHFEDGLEIEDLGSTNGTRVQGQRLRARERTVVGALATIEFGDVLAVYRAPGGPGAVHDMAALRRLLQRAAPSPLPILLTGETGVGKSTMARLIHEVSGRAGALVVVDCGAIPPTLVESHLFGHLAGSFTGAAGDAKGALAAADGGTVFLDEIGELPLAVQPRLLRALQNSEVQPIGATLPVPLDLRFVAATCRDLERDVANGRFREDLYFRLAGLVATVPPLRTRTDEFPEIVAMLLADLSKDLRRELPELAPDALAWLQGQPWPGNLRELRNVLQRAVVLGDRLDASTLSQCAGTGHPRRGDAERSERERISDALRACAGNQTQAARMLGVSRRTLVSRLDEHGVPRPRKGRG